MFVLVTVFGQFRFDAAQHLQRGVHERVGPQGRQLRPHRRRRGRQGQEHDPAQGRHRHRRVRHRQGLTLTEGTKAAVRYENLIGDRYLSLEEGPGSVRKLQPGQTIPLARTSPALDVDALIGGFRPLFRALDPDQVNALSGELLRVFQGQGGTISSVLAQTSALTTTLAGRDQLIGEVITNLNTVLGTFATRDDQFSEGLDKLSQLVAGAGRPQDRHRNRRRPTSTPRRDSVADLLTAARQPIKDTVTADRSGVGPDHGRPRLRRQPGQDASRRVPGAGPAGSATATTSASISATRF